MLEPKPMELMDCSQVRCRLHQRCYDAETLAALAAGRPLTTTMAANLTPQIDWQQLQQLFNDTAFWAQHRPLADLQTAVLNSHPVVSAIDSDRLIGFARATSDGIYRATIWDVIVHPDYQGAGIGRKLVQTILSHPVVNKAERVYLMTTNKQRFYERIGFEVNTTTTMVLHNQPFEAVPVQLPEHQSAEHQLTEHQLAEPQAEPQLAESQARD